MNFALILVNSKPILQLIWTAVIRHQWLRDFPETLDRYGIRSTLGRFPIKSSGACVLGCCALRGSDSFHSNRINSPGTRYGKGKVLRFHDGQSVAETEQEMAVGK